MEEKIMDLKFAVLVDADNISHKYNKRINREITIRGEILIKQVWCDWRTHHKNSWKNELVNEPETIHQQDSGKNATDSRIIIEAIILMLLNPDINAFCIVSSDADFHVLAKVLKKYGKYVLGIGEEKKTNSILKESFDEFVILESLKREETGILLDNPKYFGFIKNKRGVFHFLLTDIDSDIEKMSEGAQVIFKILKEPDPTQPDIKNRRGKAANVRLIA